MRLTRLSFRGYVCFRDAQPVTIDFDQLGSGLIAVVGENGAGKTTTLEAVPAALYSQLPSREEWYAYFNGRDAFVEAAFEDRGEKIVARVQVDAETRKTERYLLVNGIATTTGRAREFEERVLGRFGSYELFLASILGSQRRNGNFLDAPKAARKDRFAELLALGRLQAMHATARDRRARAEQVLDTARAMLAAVAGVTDTITQLEEAQGKLRDGADHAAHQLETAREEEAASVSGLERAKTAAAAAESARQAEKEARRRVTEAEAELVRAEEQPGRARRDADARRKTVAAAGVDLDGQARKRHTDATAALERRRAAIEAQLADAGKVAEAQEAVPALEAAAAQLEAGARELVQAEAEERAAGQRLAAAEQAVEHAQHDLEDRRAQLNQQAGLLEQVPCGAAKTWSTVRSGPKQTAALAEDCQLLAKAREASATAATLAIASRYAEEVEAATQAYAAAQKRKSKALVAAGPTRLQEVRQQLAELRPLAARGGQIDQARLDIEGLGDERIQIDAALEADLREAAHRADAAAQELEKIDADLAEALLEAEEVIAGARARLDEARQAERTAADELRMVSADVPSIETKQRELAQATATRKALEGQVREADQLLAACVAKLDEARAQLAVAEQRRLEVKAAETEVGDWTLLEDALGRDGIQALEIDAAGPEVARLANELLRAGVGPRWTISFETLREKKSSPGEYSEAFDIRVYDEGRERSVEGISGGERVFVGEAIALALAIFNARKSGVAWRTLFRDETSGALSLQNATHYVDMLRRALQLGGFHQVVFIAHQPEVYERADARLVVAGGHVRVEGVERPEAVPA